MECDSQYDILFKHITMFLKDFHYCNNFRVFIQQFVIILFDTFFTFIIWNNFFFRISTLMFDLNLIFF